MVWYWCSGRFRVLPEFPRIRTNAGSQESTEGALVQPLKSDLKRERCRLTPFYQVQGRKTVNGFFLEKKTCLAYPSALQALSGLEWKYGDVPAAKEKRLGQFLISDEQLSLTPI